MAAPFSGSQGVSAGWISPATGASTSAGGPLLQGGPQICNACGYPLPSNKNTIGQKIPCKQCGYVELPNVPQIQRPLPLQQPQLHRNATVPFAVAQPAIHQECPHPSTNVPSPVFQPILHSTPTDNAGVPAENEHGFEMSQVTNIGEPREHSEPPEQCFRCCFLRESQTPGHQPYAKGEQGGLQPTAIPRIVIQGNQEMSKPNVQNAVSGDPFRWHPETCHRCCSARVPHPTVERDRPVTTNAPPVAPTSYRLLDTPEPVAVEGNAGEKGGEGNEFFVIDETSGKAERWNLLPAAKYNLISPQGANGTNVQSGSPVAPEPPQQRPINFPTPVSGSVLLPHSAAGVQIPRLPEVPGRTERAADSSSVFVRVPDPSALSTSDWTAPQLLQQAAMLELSQRRDKSPAVFVRFSPPAGNVALQNAVPQTSREIPPPVTTFGKLALQALQDVGSESRELQRQSSGFLKKYRKHVVRTDAHRQVPPHFSSEYGDLRHLRQNQPPEDSVLRSSAAGNVALQSAVPQTSREIPPPVTTFGKLALQALQDVGPESRELKRQSSGFLRKYRKHVVRTDAYRQVPQLNWSEFGDFQHLRQNQRPEDNGVRSSRRSRSVHVRLAQHPAAAKEHISQATPYPASTGGRPQPMSEARKSVSVSTQTGRHRGRSASPAPTDDSQEENPQPATQRVFVQPIVTEDSFSLSRRIREDFSSSESSNNIAEDSDGQQDRQW